MLDDGLDDDGWDESGPLLPPEDRLWRHPSEIGRALRDTRGRWGEPRVLTVALLAGIVGALLASGTFFVVTDEDEPAPAVQNIATPASVLGRAQGAVDVARITERVSRAVVSVRATSAAGDSSGSGVIIRSDGVILTNAHVVAGAREIVVTLFGSPMPAKLKGVDVETDIAVITVDPPEDLPRATLGYSTAIRLGKPAVSVAASRSQGGHAVSSGIFSATGAEVETKSGAVLYDMIQTDAPLIPGTTGGALVDETGALVGITTANVSDAAAARAGYAIPIEIARLVADSLLKTGRVVRVWLGIEGHELDVAGTRSLEVEGGVVVDRVAAHSPAAKSGLASGDVITAVDGMPITSMTMLVVILRTREPGNAVEIRLHRGGEMREVPVELLERPRDGGPRR